jgi:hypothetical protein
MASAIDFRVRLLRFDGLLSAAAGGFGGRSMKNVHARHGLLLAGALVCFCGATGAANAITLPPGYDYSASQDAAASVDGLPVAEQKTSAIGPAGTPLLTSPGGTVGPGTSSSSGSIAITPEPRIKGGGSVSFTTPPSAYNTGDGQYGSNAYYSGNLTYYFEIGGPTSSVAVNAKAVAAYTTSALPSGGLASGVINFNVTQLDTFGDPISPDVIRDTTGSIAAGSYHNPTAATSGGFTENGTYNLLTNTIYRVAMQVIAQVSIVNTGSSDPAATGGSASILASLDPTFAIASGVANADQYSFVFSDGIGNASPPVSNTPVPAALPLFVSGLGLFGLFGVRRNRRGAATPAV